MRDASRPRATDPRLRPGTGMRLAVFTSKYPARVATFFERDIRGLLAAGVEVDVFPIYPLDERMWEYCLEMLSEDVLPREKIHHLTLREAVASMRPRSLRRSGAFLRDAAAICAASARYGPITLAKSAYIMPKAWAWAERFPGPYDHVLAYWGNYAASCAYVYHRLTESNTPFSIFLHAGTDLYFRPAYLRQKLLYADSVITCIEFNRRFLAEQFPDIGSSLEEKLHVSYHGLDLEDLAFDPEGRPPSKLIGVGRLDTEKGFDYLLRAVQRLVARGLDVELELVGDGPEEKALRSLSRELGIVERVNFRGWLRFEAVEAAMRGATVLVHPSAGLGDGLPNVIREAMAVGTPVVASDVAGISEALHAGRCGLLVPTRDAEALAAAIERLLRDPQLRRRLTADARRRAEEKFDLWKIGTSLAAHLGSVRRRGGAHRAAIGEKASQWSQLAGLDARFRS